jgi:RNA polymerase sigma factor (sigma-70 family)
VTPSPDHEALFELAYRAARRVKDDHGFAEDVAQDVLEKLVVHPSRLPYAEAFVQAAAKNRALDLVRGPRGRDAEEHEDDRRAKPGLQLSEEVALRDAVAALNPNLSRALELKEAGYASKEIAEKLGVAPGTIRNWISDAREALRAVYESGPPR